MYIYIIGMYVLEEGCDFLVQSSISCSRGAVSVVVRGGGGGTFDIRKKGWADDTVTWFCC